MDTHPETSRRSLAPLSAGRVRRLPPQDALPPPAPPPPPLRDADDATLARALIARDPEARSVVWLRFKPLVARTAARFFDSRADIDDCVQEVFLCLLNRVHTLTHPAALRSFIVSITRFTITYQKKRFLRRRYEPLADHHAEALTVTIEPETRETLTRVFQRLARAGTLDRTAFLLRFVHGLEILEVANVLGRSPATVKRRLARTRRRVLARVGRGDLPQALSPAG